MHESCTCYPLHVPAVRCVANSAKPATQKPKKGEKGRPYPLNVRKIVEEMMTLTQEEADELCRMCTQRMTPGSSKGPGDTSFRPTPVASRKPFPHAASMFGGLSAHMTPCVKPMQYMPALMQMIMQPHQQVISQLSLLFISAASFTH
jgi:hypothetical protein